MLLVDANILLYARGNHPHSPASRRLLGLASDHPEWKVPFLVILEVIHYLQDAGEYGREILAKMPIADTTIEDLQWALARSRRHEEINDGTILACAHRLGAEGVISYDSFFHRQDWLPSVRGITPDDLLDRDF